MIDCQPNKKNEAPDFWCFVFLVWLTIYHLLIPHISLFCIVQGQKKTVNIQVVCLFIKLYCKHLILKQLFVLQIQFARNCFAIFIGNILRFQNRAF